MPEIAFRRVLILAKSPRESLICQQELAEAGFRGTEIFVSSNPLQIQYFVELGKKQLLFVTYIPENQKEVDFFVRTLETINPLLLCGCVSRTVAMPKPPFHFCYPIGPIWEPTLTLLPKIRLFLEGGTAKDLAAH